MLRPTIYRPTRAVLGPGPTETPERPSRQLDERPSREASGSSAQAGPGSETSEPADGAERLVPVC